MDIKKALLKEYTSSNTNRIVNYVGSNPTLFNQLVKLLILGPYRVSQRVSWPISICVEQRPNLAKPHLNTFLKILKKETIHDAVRRNIIRLLQFIEIPKRYYGKVWSVCYQFMETRYPIAIRVFSMTVLAKIANQPDLKNELILLIENHIPLGSAGYISRARKVLKELKK